MTPPPMTPLPAGLLAVRPTFPLTLLTLLLAMLPPLPPSLPQVA
jgi:hypothetical protein